MKTRKKPQPLPGPKRQQKAPQNSAKLRVKKPVSKTSSKTTDVRKREAEKITEKSTSRPQSKSFPIVGIGASAGGLEAFSQLLETLPVDTGMAFIFVQHLDPTRVSMAPEILARTTRMPVHEVKNGTNVVPNHVYLLPPNFNMAILHGVLSLLPRTEIRGQHMTIDFFFQSLAQDQKGRAIGVVLSGTASDGTQGLEAIKAEGGLVIAQEPTSAKYDGMPKSAISSGVVDLILSSEDIAQELARISRHPYISSACEGTPETQESDDQNKGKVDETQQDALHKIFVLLRTQTGIDFSNYKYTTLKRRIERRMMVLKTETLVAYAKYIYENKDEIKSLYADILINVTEFFRDPESYKALVDHVFPSLVKNRAAGSPIRLWVAACSTGEEAYSLAILLLEFLGDEGAKIPIQIFATDISASALQKARAGVYSEGIERVVSKERLKGFFDKVEGGYKINKGIRGLCLFSKHDVTSDPPFAKLDLVSCRNVLIYFEPILQKRVIPVFHYALKPGGFLWLGRSEGTGGFSKLFTPVDMTHKIYSKTNIPTPMTFRFPVSAYVPDVEVTIPKASENVKGGIDFQKDVDRIVLSKYAPPSVVVNADLEILQFRGRTGPYLEPPSGAPSNNLLKMVRHELLHGLRMTIQTATKQNRQARQEGLCFELEGKRRTVNIEVIPSNPLSPPKQRNFVIFFEEASSTPALPQSKNASKKQGVKKGSNKNVRDKKSQQKDKRINQLEQDFSASKQYQEAMAEEFEATKEELTSANEELQSSNEEHQSTNEELETAKEELQSSNEELTTVNDELKNRNSELVTLSSDLNNLLSSVEVPILIVGNDHCIRKFTPKAEQVFKLIPSDVGRPIGDIRPSFDLDLDALVSEVTESLRPQEKEIKDRQGRWMRLQIRPYKTIDNRIDGAVITLVDIEALKQSLNQSDIALKYAKSVADTVQLPFVVLDRNFRLKSANLSFYEYFNISPQTSGVSFFDILGIGQEQVPKLTEAMKETLSSNTPFNKFEIDHESQKSGRRKLLMSGRQIDWIGAESQAMLIALEDITERKKVQETLRESERRYRVLFESIDEGFCIIEKVEGKTLDFRYVEANPAFTAQSGIKDMIGKTLVQMIPGEAEEWCLIYDTVLRSGEPIRFERLLVTYGRVLELYAFRVEDETLRRVAVIFKDITERKLIDEERAQILLREKQARLDAEKGNTAKDLFLATLSHELRTPLTSILAYSQMLGLGKLDASKSKRAIAMIEQNAKVQGQLIDDLLDVSRIIMGKLSLDLQAVDPSVVVTTAIESILLTAEKKSIQIKTMLEPSVGLVSADSVRLKQIILNLLTNAIKFSPEKSEIEVHLKRVHEPSGIVARIQVIDHGKGLSPDFLPHIFDQFSQADSSSTRIHGGLGLGLSIVRNLVELQGGTVRAESPGIGKGATFTINLPVSSQDNLPETPKVISSSLNSANRLFKSDKEYTTFNKGLRVLLIDDEASTREALAVVLQSFGAEVMAVASVSEALEIFKKFKPEVLVSDIAMPGEDGYTLIQKIKTLGGQTHKQIPSLALTAYAGAEDVKRALEAGFYAHMAKPVDVNNLVRIITALSKENGK